MCWPPDSVRATWRRLRHNQVRLPSSFTALRRQDRVVKVRYLTSIQINSAARRIRPELWETQATQILPSAPLGRFSGLTELSVFRMAPSVGENFTKDSDSSTSYALRPVASWRGTSGGKPGRPGRRGAAPTHAPCGSRAPSPGVAVTTIPREAPGSASLAGESACPCSPGHERRRAITRQRSPVARS